jgi:4-hydroxy-3-polyprenylbenzoate decarboxylase
MPFKSLRDFLATLDERGELKKIDGADWNLEMGALTELMWEANGPALLFDGIKDYPKGYRVATNLFATKERCLLALGMPVELPEDEAVEKFEATLAKYKPLPPRQVAGGPVTENLLSGDQVDLFRFPTPKWHELDGGRYLGTGCCVIQKDPDGGWVNVATYRIALHDQRTTGIFISEGHQGSALEKKYWAKGQSCPVAVSLGHDPMLFLASSGGFGFEWGVSEYDVAGYFSGAPVEVIVDEYTGLPIPANSEIVLVGEIPPPDVELRPEGPFGEFTGYYASGTRPEPVIRVKAIYHRNEPILQGSPPLMPRGHYGYSFALPVKKRNVKRKLLASGIPDVLDDCTLAIPGVEVIKIRQHDAEHARTVGLKALETSSARVIIVVDEDIDIRNPAQVLWAVGTRCDPESAVDIVKDCKTHGLDPLLLPEKRKAKNFTTGKMVLNACRPYGWRKDFPPVNRCSDELRAETLKKWSGLFTGREIKA